MRTHARIRMKNLAFLAAGMVLSMLAAGCLVGEVTHTLYLDPDGTITWSVLERDMRSDSDDAAERRQEEDSYVSAFQEGRHPVARALMSLWPDEIETLPLREKRPFSVLTSARYASVADLARNLLAGLGVRGDAWLEHDGETVRFVLVLDPDPACDDEDEDVLSPLMADLEDYRIRLTTGRFVDAVGFTLEEDGTAALPVEVETEDVSSEEIVYSLTWTVEPGSPASPGR